MFNYLTPESKFWLALLRHSTISVGSYLEQQGYLVGSKQSLESVLHVSGMSDLKKLAACGMVSISQNRQDGQVSYVVKWLGWQPIPNIRLLCFALADMMDSGNIKRSDVKGIPWDHLFNRAMEKSDRSERAGVRPIGIVEICVPARDVKQTKPYIVVNENQRATASGFKSLASRENYTVVYSREVQKMVQQSNVLIPPRLEPKEEKENPIYADWKPVPVNEWNAYHLVNWIIDKLIEVYGTPPYNRKVIMEAGIKAEGVQGLERLQAQPTECPMEEYKGYVEWLMSHKTFTVTPSNLTSPKIMLIYLADKPHMKQKSQSAIPEAFNLE